MDFQISYSFDMTFYLMAEISIWFVGISSAHGIKKAPHYK